MLARGYEYATAREWALKLKELAHVFADPYSAADFQHGPVALVEPGVPVLAVARAGAPESDLIALLTRSRDDLQAELMVVSDATERSRSPPGPCLPPGTPEWLGPDRVDRGRPAPRAAPDARPGPRSRAAPQPRKGHPHHVGRARGRLDAREGDATAARPTYRPL